jgi:hypothetical protein
LAATSAGGLIEGPAGAGAGFAAIKAPAKIANADKRLNIIRPPLDAAS